jgi:hypothetical protein
MLEVFSLIGYSFVQLGNWQACSIAGVVLFNLVAQTPVEQSEH